ncbi:hypothetical protein HYX14_04425 [Candidatus Woesearchaeota archaeon]|nr:hypothetical protein [Candidatus Woesearchaeota archaeon]
MTELYPLNDLQRLGAGKGTCLEIYLLAGAVQEETEYYTEYKAPEGTEPKKSYSLLGYVVAFDADFLEISQGWNHDQEVRSGDRIRVYRSAIYDCRILTEQK